MKCENCQKEHDGSYASGRFCSKECAKSFSSKIKREDTNKKISKKLKGSGHKPIEKICEECHKPFIIKWVKRKQICCSRSCSSTHLMKNGLASYMGKLSVTSQSEKRRSKNEIYFSELCQISFKNVLTNQPIFNGWDADVILPDLKIAILWNGKWHYEKITFKHSVKQVQNRDRIKIDEIEKTGYTPYIIKDLGKFNKDFVEKEFNKFKIYCGV